MNLRAIVFILAFVIMGLAAFAEVPGTLIVTPAAEAGVFTVIYKKHVVGKVKLSIFDKENNLVYKEVVGNIGSFTRPYNFNELAEGEYTIVLEDSNGRHEEKINYQIRKPLSFIKVSEVVNEDHKYVLNVVTNEKENVSVRIFDNLNGLIHKQEIEVNGNYGLLYNLSKVKSSSTAVITFEITTESGKVVTTTF
jgi:hypothetical protein